MNYKISVLFISILLFFLTACGTNETEKSAQEVTRMEQSIYDISVTDEQGSTSTLQQYQGKVLLIVNVASKCGYTPQYEGLQSIYTKYKDQGLEILAFPSNDFGGQEPGSIEEIKEFCTLNYNVTFPLFEKVRAKGDSIHPLYDYLTKNANPSGEIGWNFEKFLINKEGEIIGRFKSNVKPEDNEITALIENAL